MRRFKPARPSPALVVAVMALVAALAGSAVAEVATTAKLDKKEKKQVRKISKKTANKRINKQFPIGESQLADGAVSTNKLANGAVSTDKLGDGAVSTPKLGDGAVSSAKIGDGAVSNNKLANPLLSAVVRADGSLARGVGVTSSERLATGLYETDFNRDLSGCSWVAQIGAAAGVPVASGEISTSLRSPVDDESLLHIVNGSNGVVADKPFHVHVYC